MPFFFTITNLSFASNHATLNTGYNIWCCTWLNADTAAGNSPDSLHKISFQAGGEIRERYEKYWNDNWGAAPRDYNGYFLHRFLLFAGLNLNDRLVVYGELKSALHSGLDIPARPVDQDKLDFQQLYLTYKLNESANQNTAQLKVGRQEFSLGSTGLVDKRNYTNAMLSFDGVSVLDTYRTWKLNAFAFRQSRMSAGIFDNWPDADRTLWGLYLTSINTNNKSGGIDLYYIGQNRRRISYTFGDYINFYKEGAYSETRHTFGLRFFDKDGAIDYDFETMGQLGTYSKDHQQIKAWRIGAILGYSFLACKIKTRIYLNVDISSGDRDSTDHSLNTFHSPYPDISDPSTSNLSGVKLGFEATLSNKLSVNFFDWLFWRTDIQDGIYGFLGFPYRAAGHSYPRYIGNCPTVLLTWPLNKNFSLMGLYATEFVDGGFLSRAQPGEDLSYAGLSLTYKFSLTRKLSTL